MMTENQQSTTEVVSNGGGEGNSPQSRRRSLSSPWASVVRGDPEQNPSPTAAASGVPAASLSPPPEQYSASDNSLIESSGSDAAQPESSDANGDGNAGRPWRPAWNRPVNGVPEPVTVMGGAVSWPALSETTRSLPRSSSEASRPVADGSVSSSQAPIISQPPQRPANNNAHTNPTVNNSMPSRPRSRNRGGGSSSMSGTSQNAFNQHPLPMPPPFHVFEVPYGMVPPVLDASVRGPRPVIGVGGSHSHAGNDHSQRNNSRRGGYGPRARGDGVHPNNHGGRRDQDRRDVHRPPHYLPPHMGYMPSPLPPGAAPFMAPPPVRVFPGQLGFDAASPFIYVPSMPPDSFRAMPIVPPPPPFYPPADTLTNMIVKQIDFYFSDDNLAKDNFLRSNMDDHGWVPITVIASFRRIDQLTKDIPLILVSLRYSTVVEVQDGKVRRRNEWRKWLPASGWVNSDSVSNTSTASENELATSLREVSLDDSTTNNMDSQQVHTEMTAGRLLPEELTVQSGSANGEGASEGNHSISV